MTLQAVMAANPLCGSADADEQREEVRKILESPGFAGARQLQSFLTYASEAVFQGRSAIEQVEIAKAVLGRGDEFNPLDDPSVRKIASLLRQRLQRYYETDGASDRVVITLPLRSYLPVFQFRDQPDSVPPPEREETAALPEADRRRWPLWIAAAALILGAACGYVARTFIPKESPAGEFRMRTVRGGIINSQSTGLPKNAILLGPEVKEHDEAVVRMRFRPTQPLHQAGLLIFGDANNYVELGRVFRLRTFLEFAAEIEGHHQKTEAQVSYDPEGQTLAPVWLALRRNGNEYRAFTSTDGIHWIAFGEPRVLSRTLAHPRVALYAFHGRTSATPAEAIFDHLSVGPGLHDWPADTPVETVFGGWQPDKTCPAASSLIFDGPGIRFTGLSMARPCTAEIARPVPQGDWSISTRIDFVPEKGAVTGLQVRGTGGRFRVVRWDIHGHTTSAEVVHGEQSHVADFPGNPPLILRISCRRGVLRGSFSRDDEEYTDLGVQVPLASLGGSPVIGYQLGMNRWMPGETVPPLVYWVHEEISQLHLVQ